jgi:hypothetical protein
MADMLTELSERIKALGGDWTKYAVVGSFLLYVVGYLALRFHLTAIGVGTDLAVLDERYLFTGARFLVYLVATVPSLVLAALPVAVVLWAAYKLLPRAARASLCGWVMQPTRLAVFGIVFAVIMIQFVMRQCFAFNDLLLVRKLPPEPAWLVKLLLDDRFMPLYFSALVAACAVPLAILWALRKADAPRGTAALARGLLAFLVAVQVLLLPVNYGVLIVDKTLPRVAALGETPLAAGEDAWLVWEGKDGVTFLVRSQQRQRRALITLPRTEVKRIEILGFDRILPTLFGHREGDKG